MKLKYKKTIFFLLIIGILTTLTREGFSTDKDEYGPIHNFRGRPLILQLVATTCFVVLRAIPPRSIEYLWKRLIGPSFMPDRSTVIPAPDLLPTAKIPCANILSSAINSFKDIPFQSYSSLRETVEEKSKMNPALVFELKYYKKVNATSNCLKYNGDAYQIDNPHTIYHYDTFWKGRPWHQQIGNLTTAHIDPLCYVDTFLEHVQAQAATCSLNETDTDRALKSTINPDYLAFENLTGKYLWQDDSVVTDPKKAELLTQLLETSEYSQFIEVTARHNQDEICVAKSPTFIPYQFKKRDLRGGENAPIT